MKFSRALIPIILFEALIFFGANVCEAQTNPAQFKTVLVTNWVKPGIVMRVVDEKLYNTYYSKLWGDPITLMPQRRTIANNGHFLRYELVANVISSNSVFCDVDAITWWPETYTDAPQDEDRETIKSVVIYHYPNPSTLVTGQPFSCRCMKVENYLSHGISYEAFDCGTQYTNLIPVITNKKNETEPTSFIKQSQ
jgi:hypothetical protein